MRQSIVYVTRDLERAQGLPTSEEYKIVTNRTTYSESLQNGDSKYVIKIDPDTDPRTNAIESLRIHPVLNTAQLLESAETAKIIAGGESGTKDDKVGVLVFKNTIQIEEICKKNSWKLLNPSAELAERIENKISQIEWLGKLGEKYLPPHKIATLKEIIWQKKPLVIQWAHGHTGEGTTLVNSAEELKILQIRFPDRVARVTDFISGPSFTLNIIISKNSIYTGNISYQITGIPPFTDNPFSTIGNDWSLPHTIFTEKEIEYVSDMAREIGHKMALEGWIGMCGIDVMKDDLLNKIFLIEINARQPASTTYESLLQQKHQKSGIAGSTIFEAYIAALSGKEILLPIIMINDGAQIIQRVNKSLSAVGDDVIGSLRLAGYETILYENIEPNSDLLRIQSSRGIMETHGKFNTRGKEISDFILRQESN
jgi:predicted ATP-grasp superfamily ATP-dependent carboligase